MRQIVLATTNPGKIKEFRALLPEDIDVVSLMELGLEAPEETGETFAENAEIKSVAVSRSVPLLVVADDSGLEVDALGGDPGVRSARFAGEPADDRRNIEKLLGLMSGTAGSERGARFQCAVSVAWDGREVLQALGSCDGSIGYDPRGSDGFGYDPIFVLPTGRTMAELTAEEKNEISHRSRAFRAVAEPLRALIEELDPAGGGCR